MDNNSISEAVDYDDCVDKFNRALISTLRKHSIAESFLELWVPDADPVVGITNMVDAARLAGLPSIKIRVRQSTVPDASLPELKGALANICSATFMVAGGSILLEATNIKQATVRKSGEAGDRAAKPTYWDPSKLGTLEQAAAIPESWRSAPGSDFDDVHPHFRSGLKTALARVSFERTPNTPSMTEVQVSGEEDAIALTFNIDRERHVVTAASHQGTTRLSERAILDLFCKEAQGLPIQEVADHVALKLLDSLVDQDKSPPVAGVLLPVNSGAPFMLAARLARRAYEAYRTAAGMETETNFYYSPPSQQWHALSADERREKIDGILRAFLQSEALYPDDMSCLRIDRNRYGYYVRVIVGFSDRIPTSNKPNLMRLLERRLRRDAEPKIDLVAERAKDSSPLRRLS